MEELIKLIEEKVQSHSVEWMSIKTAILEHKKIAEGFVDSFEKRLDLIDDVNWLELKKEIKYIRD